MQQQGERYQRQLILPEIGRQGQEMLGQGRVLLVGLGGLGSVIAVYLCAAGVGFLRVVDQDHVELSNLNRQILHWTKDIGSEKTVSARDKLLSLNPEVCLEALQLPVDTDTARDLVKGCQVIVDGTDTLETRRVLNRASLENDLPFVHAGINGFNGMLTTFVPGQTSCFECLFSQFGSPGASPPVLGAIAGVVGSLQSLEVIKYLLGMSHDLLSGRLLCIQGKSMRFREIRLEKNRDCPECGERRGVGDTEREEEWGTRRHGDAGNG